MHIIVTGDAQVRQLQAFLRAHNVFDITSKNLLTASQVAYLLTDLGSPIKGGVFFIDTPFNGRPRRNFSLR